MNEFEILAASYAYTKATAEGQGAIKGDKGDKGDPGPKGDPGEGGNLYTYDPVKECVIVSTFSN